MDPWGYAKFLPRSPKPEAQILAPAPASFQHRCFNQTAPPVSPEREGIVEETPETLSPKP